jgi:F0F1-type ATP synthase membrane subunit b/b'
MIIPGFVYGSSAGHHSPGPLDLIEPFFNFIVFFGGIWFLINKSISLAFTRYSESIKEKVSEAESRCREASFRVNDYEKKLKEFEQISKKIITDTKTDIEKFKNNHVKEIEASKARMIKDYNLKAKSEALNMMRAVDKEFVESIVNETKSRVAGDLKLSSEISNSLLQQI